MMDLASIPFPVAHNTPYRFHTVPPADFLALAVRSAIIADRHFTDAVGAACNARRQLRLDAEALLLETRRDGLEHVTAKYLVTGFHVAQPQAGKRVRQARQNTVGDIMPQPT